MEVETMSTMGQAVTAKPDTEETAMNLMGHAATLSSLALLLSTGYVLVGKKTIPRWYLWVVTAKLGIDLVQAGWVMSLVRRGTTEQAIPPTGGV